MKFFGNSWVSFAIEKDFWPFKIILLSIFMCLMSYQVIWTQKCTRGTFSRGGGSSSPPSHVKFTKNNLMSSRVNAIKFILYCEWPCNYNFQMQPLFSPEYLLTYLQNKEYHYKCKFQFPAQSLNCVQCSSETTRDCGIHPGPPEV